MIARAVYARGWFVLRRLGIVAVSGGCALACGASAPVATAPAPPVAAPAEDAPSAVDRLVALLRSFDAGGPLLDGVDPQVRELVEEFAKGLSAEEVAALREPDGAAASIRPLTHVALGGTSPAAYFAVAAGDLAELAIGGLGRVAPERLVVAAANLARRAASSYLREAALGIGGAERPTAAQCDAVDRAARVLGRRDVRRSARELAFELEPTTLRRLALAEIAALDLAVAEADRHVAAAPPSASDPWAVHSYRARVIVQLEAARVAAGPDTGDAAIALGRARALLSLDRPEEALTALEPHTARAERHAGLAVALARAKLGSVCPGLPSGAHLALCAASWKASPVVAGVVPLVERAWKSELGRDAAALEGYIGLTLVVPTMYGLGGEGAGDPKMAFRDRVRAIGDAARPVSDESSSFAAIVLLSDALVAAVDAHGPGTSGVVPDAAANALVERAAALAARAPTDRMVQGAVLGVAALLSQRRDAAPLVDALAPVVEDSLRPTRASLRLWSAAVHEDDERAELGRAELLGIAETLGDLERATSVLLMAEADAARRLDPAKLALLGRIAKTLAAPSSPVELRLRAALDAAGAASRAGERATAVRTLEQVVVDVADDPAATTLPEHILARGYLIVLRAQEEPRDREDLVRKLRGLLAAGAPESVAVWLRLWIAEFEHLAATEKCAGNRVCSQRADRRRSAAHGGIEERIGAEAAALVRRGVLAGGSVVLSFHYGDSGKLQPMVAFVPKLWAIEVPRAAAATR